ncbi:Os06g0291200 [Oryza sativa Japonica Group]|uniref:Glycosyltransferase n=1 Tax=Oryza sativa subsp. japonica TaxID=39947 RepID=C7J463_ORYSJ|nr:Os06g0291200 [Oryza sativa Japonica Group]|eukprot:NP_001174729.1 Os06g0291200 [Oryza sativa Japonica Group]
MAPPTVLNSGEPDARRRERPHVVFIPSAGMGHLLPFFRFIGALSSHDVDISVVTVLPTVSAAEADHFARLFHDFPSIRRVDFNLLPLDASEFPGADPFLLRWEALRRSMHLLAPAIAGVAPRATAVVTDVTLVSHVNPIAKDLRLQCHDAQADVGDVDVPGVRHLQRSWLPQPLLDLDMLFTKQFIENGREVVKTDGVLINTFDALEPVALAALRDGTVVRGFPPVFAVGPYSSLASEKKAADADQSSALAWLDQQPARSVVYVAFGNRCTVSNDQLREIAAGLEASGCRFLWILKTTVVDRDEAAAGGVRDVLGDGFMERVKGRGMVTKEWVDQEAVLGHPAVGLFLSHSGWNSVTEAAAAGVPLLAWPRGGDHRVAATVVASSGVGVWMEQWSWDGEEWLVSGEEIGGKVKEMMADDAVRERAAKVGEEAAKAVAEGGTSHTSMLEFVAKLKAA